MNGEAGMKAADLHMKAVDPKVNWRVLRVKSINA